MFKILGAKNRRKNLHKDPGPPFQIRGGPGSFSNAGKCAIAQKMGWNLSLCILEMKLCKFWFSFAFDIQNNKLMKNGFQTQ